MNKFKLHTTLFLLALLLLSCGQNYVPRPYGYFRVDLPEHSYYQLDTLNLPYRFDVSSLAKITSSDPNEKFWIDIHYPTLNAVVHCSYLPIQNNLLELSEEARKYVYKHSIKADGIGEMEYDHPEKQVHGIYYDLKGNTASAVQFVLTDSNRHFFRGALYFENVPNKDSIAPMADYIRVDMIRLMETFEWKND